MADLNQIELPNGTTYNLSSYKLLSSDTRNDNQLPSWYMSNYPKCTVEEFKSCSSIGVNSIMSGTYCVLNTITPWTDSSGGRPVQIAVSDSGVRAQRVATADNTWGSWVKLPNSDTNTTYTFANGTNGFTVTPSGGSAQTVTVTPSIANNVTGSGTSGYLTKFNGTNTVTNGPALGSDTTKYLRNDGTWAVPASGGGNVWEGTLAQYNALATHDPATQYYITDAPSHQTLTLEGLEDVSISHLASEQVLVYNGTQWVNVSPNSAALADLNDVDVTSPAANQVLKYDGSNWQNGSLANVATSGSFTDLSNKPGVSNLTDTTILSATNGQVLKYNGSKWVNGSNVWEGTQAQYNAISVKDPNVTYFITDAGEGTAERLNDLEDVDIVNPQNGQLLLYNSNNQTWENSGQYTDFDIRDMDARNITAEQVTTDNVVSDTATVGSVNLPHRYSTEEHVVGYWIDGSPIYEKTLQYDSVQSISSGGNITVPSTMWSMRAIPVDIVFYTTLNTSKICWRFVTAQINDSGVLQLFNGRAATMSLDTFTIQYIKL